MSEKYQIDVTCIQGHRIHHPDKTVKHKDLGNGWVIITSSEEKAENKAAIRGVGILVKPRAFGSVLNVESVSPRISVATFNGGHKTTIVSCYNLISYSYETDTVKFYGILHDVIHQLPKHNVIIIAGDMNSQVASENIAGFSSHDKTNRNDNCFWI